MDIRTEAHIGGPVEIWYILTYLFSTEIVPGFDFTLLFLLHRWWTHCWWCSCCWLLWWLLVWVCRNFYIYYSCYGILLNRQQGSCTATHRCIASERSTGHSIDYWTKGPTLCRSILNPTILRVFISRIRSTQVNFKLAISVTPFIICYSSAATWALHQSETGDWGGDQAPLKQDTHLLWDVLSISCYGSRHNSYFDLQIICRMLFLVSAHPNCVKHQFTGVDDDDAGNSNDNHHQLSNVSPQSWHSDRCGIIKTTTFGKKAAIINRWRQKQQQQPVVTKLHGGDKIATAAGCKKRQQPTATQKTATGGDSNSNRGWRWQKLQLITAQLPQQHNKNM